MTAASTWVIMPILGAPAYTRDAIADVLAQSVPIRLLLINQGVDDAFREELERIAEAHEDRVFLWSHQPPLLSLAATWNRALDFVWATGGETAFVVNNDTRIDPWTVGLLTLRLAVEQAFFVSCVGWDPDHWAQIDQAARQRGAEHEVNYNDHGGPDFSCFLISRACHQRYRFDEGFIPAFCEDCSYHRELMLAGDGQRIFSVNLPYLHYGSATLKSMTPAQRAPIDRAISAGSRAHYERCWGGPPNHERYLRKGDPSSARDGVTNPELQAAVGDVAAFRALIGDGRNTATPDSTNPC
jgi:hypothetical protein